MNGKPSFYWLIGISTFIYLCLRAYYIPITHDEASTFLVYVTQPLSNTFLGIPPIATNHILHTLLIKCSVFLFGNEVFFLRIPSLLSYLLYFFFSLRLLQRLTSKPFWIILGLVFLHFHPYLLEFFALSRGYGLSIALMMGSIYYVFAYFNDWLFRQVFAALFLGALAVYGNFSFGFYYISLLAFLFFFALTTYGLQTHVKPSQIPSSKKPSPIAVMGLMFVLTLILGLFCFVPLKNLLVQNAFYSGGTTGFIGDTVGSLIRWNLYGLQYFGGFDIQVIGGLCLGLILLAFLMGFLAFFAGIRSILPIFKACKNQALKGLQIFGGLLVVMVFFSICYVFLFEGKYAVGRTALFFFPLSLLLIFTFLLCWQRFLWVKIGAFLWAAMLVFHLFQTLNIKRSYEWILDADTPAMLDFVQERAATEQHTLSLGVHWLMLQSVDYYQYLEPLQNIEVYSDKKLIVNQYDYYYIHENHANVYLEGYKIVKRFGEGRILLLRRNNN